MNLNDLIKLNSLWANSTHNINNPNGSWKALSVEHELASRQNRIVDLNQLLWIVYEHQSLWRGESWIDQKNTDAIFLKYCKQTLMRYYPFGFFDTNALILKDFEALSNDASYLNFIDSIINVKGTSCRGIKKELLLPSNQTIDGVAFKAMCDKRADRILLLAKLCHKIDDIQCIDAKNDGANYGKRRALSAYLGQWIMRCFPIKDIVYASENFARDGSAKNIYEHYTPMSFFRDLIWWHPTYESNNDKLVPFSEHDWFDIIQFAYRVVNLTVEENDKLDSNHFRSRRSFNTYQHDLIAIKIHQLEAWQIQYGGLI